MTVSYRPGDIAKIEENVSTAVKKKVAKGTDDTKEAKRNEGVVYKVCQIGLSSVWLSQWFGRLLILESSLLLTRRKAVEKTQSFRRDVD